jgi:hypothetical protein
MLTEGSGYRNRRRRDISFSKSFDNYRSRSGSKQDSPSIAVESVTELYRKKNFKLVFELSDLFFFQLNILLEL